MLFTRLFMCALFLLLTIKRNKIKANLDVLKTASTKRNISTIAISVTKPEKVVSKSQSILLTTTQISSYNNTKDHATPPHTIDSIPTTPSNVLQETANKTKMRNKKKNKFRIMALLDYYTADDRFSYNAAATVATKLINKNPNILPDHKVELVPFDVAGRVGLPYHIIHSTLQTDKNIHAVLGPGISGAVEITSELLTRYGLLQMSFAALNPALGDKTKMPYLFRSNPSLDAYTSSVIALFKKNGWKRAAIIYDFGNAILLKTAYDLRNLLFENGIALELFVRVDSAYISSDIGQQESLSGFYQDIVSKIKLIKASDIRVIIGVIEPLIARYIFCEVYKAQLFGDRYTWIIPNGNAFSTWTVSSRQINNCTNDQLRKASRGMLLFKSSPKRVDGKMTIANKTADEIYELVRQEKRKCFIFCDTILNSLYVYDAIWALALTFDETQRKFKRFSIENYGYFKENKIEKLSQGFYSYKGEHRTRTAELVLTQYNDGSPYTTDSIYKYYGIIGYSNGQDDSITINETIQRLIIPNYTVPRDGPILFYPAEQFHLGILMFAWTFSVGGILLALIFLYVNIRYKDKLLIKMSSPNINNVIIIGCIFCYISVILYGLDSRTVAPSQIPLACNAVVLFLNVGFTLAFGSLFSKTWRIYRIFTKARTLYKTGIRDFHLFIVVFIMMAIDCVIIALWMMLSPFQLAEQKLEATVDVELDKVTTPILHRCSCDYYIQFVAATYVYKGLLLIFGLFVAWETRRIKVTVLNDSKYIGMSVYIVALFSSIAAVVTHSLSNTTSFEASYVIFAICIFSCTTVTLCFVFLPKIQLLIRKFEDPNFKNGRPVIEGESIYSLSYPNKGFPNEGFDRSIDDDATLTRDSAVSDNPVVAVLMLPFATFNRNFMRKPEVINETSNDIEPASLRLNISIETENRSLKTIGLAKVGLQNGDLPNDGLQNTDHQNVGHQIVVLQNHVLKKGGLQKGCYQIGGIQNGGHQNRRNNITIGRRCINPNIFLPPSASCKPN